MAKYHFDFTTKFDDGDWDSVECHVEGKDNFISAIYSGLNAVVQQEGRNKECALEAHQQFWDIVESARTSGRQVQEVSVTITEVPSSSLTKEY